jgi:hypothetical protein
MYIVAEIRQERLDRLSDSWLGRTAASQVLLYAYYALSVSNGATGSIADCSGLLRSGIVKPSRPELPLIFAADPAGSQWA